MAYFSEKVGCEVTHLIVPNDGDSSCWTCDSMLCGESHSANTLWAGQWASSCSKGKVHHEEHFVECKAMSSNWKGIHPAVGTLFTGQFSSSLQVLGNWAFNSAAAPSCWLHRLYAVIT